MKTNLYTKKFYEDQMAGSIRSARIIAPIVCEVLTINSVLDLGCGVGTWLRAFAECGADRLIGLDGEYVPQDKMLIDISNFKPINISSLDSLPKDLDLCVCMEVLEHLPHKVGKKIVRLLTEAAPAILFSAAIPGQGGTNHINERWHHEWHQEFSKHDFSVFDIVRPRVYHETDVEPWYRQNAFLYINEKRLRSKTRILNLSTNHDFRLTPIEPRILAQFMSTRGLCRHLIRQARQGLSDFIGGES